MKGQLSILIATIGKRNDKFLSLLDNVLEQAEPYNIEVIAYWNNGEASIGEIRQSLLEEADGEYVCFIDDDDNVPEWYCEAIMEALGKDYVGFQVELFEKDKQMPPVFHSIKYGVWHQDEAGYYRGITHLNPIKRELALLGDFGKQGAGEDESWARMVTPHVRTENYINRIMYYYYHDLDESTFRSSRKEDSKKYIRPIVNHNQFKYHPKSRVEGTMQ